MSATLGVFNELKRLIIAIILVSLLFMASGCDRPIDTGVSEISLAELIEKSKSITEYYCEAELSNDPIRTLGRTWVKNARARVESHTMEGDKPLTTYGLILDEKAGIVSQYTIRHSVTSGISSNMTYAAIEEEFPGIRCYTFLREMDDLDPTKAKIIKLESVNNYKCAVVDSGETDYKKILWISIDLGVPVKAEIKDQLIVYKIKVGSGSVNDKDLLQPQT